MTISLACVLSVALLTACASTVVGVAAPASAPAGTGAVATSSSPSSAPAVGSATGATVAPSGSTSRPPLPTSQTQVQPSTAAPAADIVLIGDKGTPTEQVVKDSLSDIIRYWQTAAPAIFGQELPPLDAIYSIDPTDPQADFPASCMNSPADVSKNAFYCPAANVIAYDSTNIQYIADTYGDLDVFMWFAHEFGHALQTYFITEPSKSIVVETQADCFSGVVAEAVSRGDMSHFALSPENLDLVLADLIFISADPVGFDPNNRQAHGSGFDRISATQEGYQDGAASCVSNFNNSRVFTAETFTSTNGSTDGMGNLDLPQTITETIKTLSGFAKSDLGVPASFVTPELNQQAPSAACTASYQVSACPAAGTIEVGDSKILATLHDDYGDYGVATVLSLAYFDYVNQQYGTTNDARVRICQVGAVTADLDGRELLSPGDFDEAMVILILAGSDNSLIDTGAGNAWDRVNAFRDGIYGGVSACS